MGQNLKKGKIWNSIEVHAIYALFFILGYSVEGLQVLKTFLNSEHEEIYHPVLLAQMLLSPLNSIVDDVLIPLVDHECDLELIKNREAKAKLNVLFRFDIMCRMLAIVGEFGMEPHFQNQKFVKKLIKNPAFGELSGTNSLVHVTGFTAAFLLTLPELFMQWRDQKDGVVESNEKQHKVVEFLGQQCHWPSFSNDQARRTKTQKSPRGKGSMLSNANANAKSLPPFSFLPDVFDLTKVFKDCLDGSTKWETNSLCEDPKMTQSSPRKRPADPAEEQAEDQPSAELTRKQLAKKRKEEKDSEEKPGDGRDGSGEEKSDPEQSEDSGEEKSEEKQISEQPGDGSGGNDEEEKSNDNSQQEVSEDEQSEKSAPVPRKKKSGSGSELAEWPSTGSDVTELIRTLLFFISLTRSRKMIQSFTFLPSCTTY